MKRTTSALWRDDLEAGKSRIDITFASHGSGRAALEAAAGKAKANCPVSKVLNAAMSMDAKFET